MQGSEYFVILLSIVVIVYGLLVLNFYLNVEDTCSKECHDDVKRIIILLLIVLSLLMPFIKMYNKVNESTYLIMIFGVSTTLNVIQFLYLRQLKNDCNCDKSLLMDIMRILNYFTLFIVMPINVLMMGYLKNIGKL